MAKTSLIPSELRGATFENFVVSTEEEQQIALELSEKYDLSGCRTETELYRITPFFRTYHGAINLPMELKEVKDFLKDK